MIYHGISQIIRLYLFNNLFFYLKLTIFRFSIIYWNDTHTEQKKGCLSNFLEFLEFSYMNVFMIFRKNEKRKTDCFQFIKQFAFNFIYSRNNKLILLKTLHKTLMEPNHHFGNVNWVQFKIFFYKKDSMCTYLIYIEHIWLFWFLARSLKYSEPS